MEDILFLSAPIKEKIWGSNYFKDVLKITDSEELIGEMWSCSAHKEGESVITNGTFKGQKLSEVFKNRKELFANSTLNQFPLLIKLISTSDKLSVQVHPDDKYALENENQYGKTEGWIILDADEESSIVIGHNAKNKEELINYINNDDYGSLLKTIKVHKGEFYPIPAKTIHALGKNILILEVQQSSDITYRFYDYHRKDKNGKERELHVQKAIENTSFEPYFYQIQNVFNHDSFLIWENEYFSIYTYQIQNEFEYVNDDDYHIVTIMDGQFLINGHNLSLGDSFIITSQCKRLKLIGNGNIIISTSLKR